ncbi:hypothetical protein [Chryseobacterium sp. CH1]|uniref:hypothetical protein n=1 Tax=Chryseobacterium sp. CH1 TaxID=713551 RepID=UPI00100AB2A1|nr:hypothetical protein [Chryseobacterium sp. CH1]RXM65588.1 hypothetical protein BOQ60_07290 [Chryseobacterium sp. CH1]
MSLDPYQPQTFKSKFNDIQLVTTEFDEPHYGYEIWKCKVYINGEVFHHEYLNYENKFFGLPENLENFVLESSNGKFIFIPYGLLLLNTESLELKKYDKSIENDNNKFISNLFLNDFLIVLNQRVICIVDMDKNRFIEKIYPYQKLVFEKMWIVKNKIFFLYKDKELDKSDTLIFNTEAYAFENTHK